MLALLKHSSALEVGDCGPLGCHWWTQPSIEELIDTHGGAKLLLPLMFQLIGGRCRRSLRVDQELGCQVLELIVKPMVVL